MPVANIISAPSEHLTVEAKIASWDATAPIEPGISASPCPVHLPSEHPTVGAEENEGTSGDATEPIGPEVSALPCPVHAPPEHPTLEAEEYEIASGEPGTVKACNCIRISPSP